MRRWFKELWVEMRARSAGRKAMGNDKTTFTAARGTMGAIGLNRSNAWDFLENDNGAYLRSMQKEPMLPPSLFVSERDRTRHGQAVPLVERCIEDHGTPAARQGAWDISEIVGEPAEEVVREREPARFQLRGQRTS